MRRTYVLIAVLLALALFAVPGCSVKVEEEIPQAETLSPETPAVPTATPSPTPVPTPTPKPTLAPVPVQQGSYQVYYDAQDGSRPVRILPVSEREAPYVLLSETPGRLALEQSGTRLWEEQLQTLGPDPTPEPAPTDGGTDEWDEWEEAGGWAPDAPYQRWSVQPESMDPVVLRMTETEELLVFSEDGTSCERFSQDKESRAAYGFEYDAAGHRILYRDSRLCRIMQRTLTDGKESVFFDPGLFYQAEWIGRWSPEDNLILVSAEQQLQGRTGWLLADADTGKKIGFLPDTYDSGDFDPASAPMPVDSDRGIYFRSAEGRVFSFYRWDPDQNRLVPLVRTELGIEADPACRIAGDRLYMAWPQEREIATRIIDLKDRTVLHDSSFDPGERFEDDFWDDCSFSLPEGTDPLDFWVTAAAYESELLLLRVTSEGTGTEKAVQPEPGPAVQAVREETDYGEFTARAHALNETYGVTILLGEDAPLFDYAYRAEPLTDAAGMDGALTRMEDVLSTYPAGFFREFTEDGYMRFFYVCLAGKIGRKSEGVGIPDVVGYANAEQDRQIIVMDMTYEVEGTFYHEVSHAIDARIADMRDENGEPCLKEEDWSAMNPPDFSYYYSYLDDDGDPNEIKDDGRYAYTSGADGQESYFIDRYSKTFPTEDRARIIEYASLGYSEYFADAPHLAAKLKWYSDLIRKHWDSASWTGPTPWEKAIPE